MRGGPISSSSISFGSRPVALASSATKDCTAKPCGMLDTERNQPMRVWASASPFSQRRLGMSNGTSTNPMPSSNGASCVWSGLKIDRMVGATLRCRQATTFPFASSPASMRSAETV